MKMCVIVLFVLFVSILNARERPEETRRACETHSQTTRRPGNTSRYLYNVGGKAANISRLPCSVINGKVGLLTTYFGAYPELRTNKTSGHTDWCNGGIPQLANLTLHEAKMRKQIEERQDIPANFTGYIVHDYESWAPPWERTSAAYKNACIALARSLLPPGTDDETVIDKAERDYDIAAIHFLAFTVNVTKALRPQAAGVGFYGYPLWTYWGNSSVQNKISRMNDKLAMLWESQTALYPSLYLPYGSLPGCKQPGCESPQMQHEYIDTHMAEAARISKAYGGPGDDGGLPILPYTWYRYHDGETETHHSPNRNHSSNFDPNGR